MVLLQAWTEFAEDGRMKPSAYRQRVVDVAEELYKFTLLLRGHTPFLVNRYSEREEVRLRGRLLSQVRIYSGIRIHTSPLHASICLC